MQTGKFCQTGILNQPLVLLRGVVTSIKESHIPSDRLLRITL
jgi:hypothetical protein